MSVYGADFAELYDVFHREKPYDDEAVFIDTLLRAEAVGPSERILDIACGTGSHAIRLARRGWAVLAVDRSTEMLRVAEEKAKDLPVRFFQRDMQHLELPEHGFDAAICLFDSIGYALTNEGIARTLTGIRRHLRPGGLFLVEFWHAPAMVRGFDPIRVRDWKVFDGSITRTSTTTLDVARQVARVTYRVDRTSKAGRHAMWTEEHENRFFLVQEMALFLHSAGFTPIHFLAGFDVAGSIELDTWHVLGLARATSSVPR